MTDQFTEAQIEAACRAMLTVSRPTVNPDDLTPAPRGMAGLIPIWKLYEHLARAALLTTAKAGERADGAMREEDRKIIEVLLEIAAHSFEAFDDGETTATGEQIIDSTHNKRMNELFDLLDDLPDDQPGYTLSPPAKAQWALRNILSAAPKAPIAEGWENMQADAARYRYLRDHCSSHYEMTWEQPAEWSIGWEFQQRRPDERFGSFDIWIDADIALQAKIDAEDTAPPTTGEQK